MTSWQADPSPTTVSRGQLRIPAALGPCEGRVFMVTDQAIASVKIESPATAGLGNAVTVKIAVLDKEDRPLDAIIPVRVDIRDPSGRDAERTGYYGAKDGRLELKLDLAANDQSGNVANPCPRTGLRPDCEQLHARDSALIRI